jgi:hypothetical protein
MALARTRKTSLFMKQAAKLAIAVPQVVAHRMTLMAWAGPQPQSSDRRELKLMSDEKTEAFNESWIAMARQAFAAQQALSFSMFDSLMWSPLRGLPSAGAVVNQVNRAAMGVLSQGMAPVHRRAVANARRLSRHKPR